jgi:hypothetical protein
VVWKGPSIVILLIYVDDLLLTSNDPDLISLLKLQLISKYKMKDLGEILEDVKCALLLIRPKAISSNNLRTDIRGSIYSAMTALSQVSIVHSA